MVEGEWCMVDRLQGRPDRTPSFCLHPSRPPLADDSPFTTRQLRRLRLFLRRFAFPAAVEPPVLFGGDADHVFEPRGEPLGEVGDRSQIETRGGGIRARFDAGF